MQREDVIRLAREAGLGTERFAALLQANAQPLSDFDVRGVLASSLKCWHRLSAEEAADLVAFFTAKRQAPLTEERIDAIYTAVSDKYDRTAEGYESHNFARAIEAAHGIGASPKPQQATINEFMIESWPAPKTSGLTFGMSKGVKITHVSTGKFVTCDSERSQHRNKDKAMEQLNAMLAAQPAPTVEVPLPEADRWVARLEEGQRPQQPKTTLHDVGFAEWKHAEQFVAEQVDFYGWRYTLHPLLTMGACRAYGAACVAAERGKK